LQYYNFELENFSFKTLVNKFYILTMTSSISSNTLKKLWKSRKTMLEVLKYRKYPVKDSDFISFETFFKKIGEGKNDKDLVLSFLTLLYKKSSLDKIVVLWPDDSSSGTIKKIHIELEKENIKRAILVINSTLSSSAKGEIFNLYKENIYIDVYTLVESQINVMNHYLVPTHTICTEVEKRKLLKEYSVKEESLPSILLSDPVIRHIGAIKGQLVKISRDSETQIGLNTITYRIVIRYPKIKGEPDNERTRRQEPPSWIGRESCKKL
jgi:DNA-directed RNA polymerase subunit H (RpoH/RPB5)